MKYIISQATASLNYFSILQLQVSIQMREMGVPKIFIPTEHMPNKRHEARNLPSSPTLLEIRR